MEIEYDYDLPRFMGTVTFVVYYLIICAHQAGLEPVSRDWLIETMGNNTGRYHVTQALSWLTHHQYIFRVVGGWQANEDRAKQLLLSVEPEIKKARGAPFQIEPNIKKARGAPFGNVVVVDSAYFPDSLLSTNNNNQGEKARGAPFGERLQSLRAVNIIGKKAEALAEHEWITPEYIAAAIADSASGDNPIGLAIFKMEHHQIFPVPETRAQMIELNRFFFPLLFGKKWARKLPQSQRTAPLIQALVQCDFICGKL